MGLIDVTDLERTFAVRRKADGRRRRTRETVRADPEVGTRMPVSILIVVDLPAPLAPM